MRITKKDGNVVDVPVPAGQAMVARGEATVTPDAPLGRPKPKPAKKAAAKKTAAKKKAKSDG